MQIRLEDKKAPQEKDRLFTVVMWILTGFMFISGVVFIPSAASVIMILFACISAPIDRLQAFYASKKLRGVVKFVLLLVLFGLSIALYQPR